MDPLFFSLSPLLIKIVNFKVLALELDQRLKSHLLAGIFPFIAFLPMLLYEKHEYGVINKHVALQKSLMPLLSLSLDLITVLSAVQSLWISGLFLATVKLKHPSWFLSAANGFWHSGHVTPITLWTLMSVNKFPQKQTAVLPYSFCMWSCFPY